MATKKSIHIWILFVSLIIAAWLLGSIIQAHAQTYTVKCREISHTVNFHKTEVGDVPGHIIAMVDNAGVLSCDDGSIATTSTKAVLDLIKGSGMGQGYSLDTYEDGSTQWTKFQETTTLSSDGKTARWEGTSEFIKGTGRFEGIQGTNSFSGKRLQSVPGGGAQLYTDSINTYTLPSK